jgi:hypothetical protein
MATPLLRRLTGVLACLLLTVLVVGSTAGTAHAADGFKYWNYFHVQDGKYVFAQTGPGDFTPKDGEVEAYRYGLSSTAQGLTPRTPATEYTVEDLCAGREAGDGEKRVGVLIDYGIPADAEGGQTPDDPRGACAVVPTAANGQQVLDAVADVRIEGALLCGVDGYPAKGCSVTVKNPPAPAAEDDVSFVLPQDEQPENTSATSGGDDGGSPWPLVGVAAAVLVIGGGALALNRRGKRA